MWDDHPQYGEFRPWHIWILSIHNCWLLSWKMVWLYNPICVDYSISALLYENPVGTQNATTLGCPART